MERKPKETVIVNGKKRSKIIVKIALLLLIEVLFLISILEYLSIAKVRKATANTLIESYNSLALAQSANILNRNSKFYQQLRMYSHSDLIWNSEEVDPELVWQWLADHADVRSYDFEDVYYCDVETGITKSDTGKEMNIKGTYMYNQILENNRNQFISEPFGTGADDSLYYICKSVTKNKKIVGIIIVTINYETLVRAVSAMKVGQNGFVLLLTGDGTVMAYPPDDQYVLKVNAFRDEKKLGFQGLTAVATDMIAGNTSTGWISHNGKKYLMVYTPVNNVTWYLSLVVPEEEVYSAVNGLRNRMIIIGILIAVILVITISLSIDLTIRPLKRLEHNIKQIATGEADLTQRLPVSGHDEIAAVTENFNLFVAKLHDIMADVKGSKGNLHNAGVDLKSGIEENSESVESIMTSLKKVNSEIENQRGSVQDTAGAINEIASSITSLENMIESQSAGITEASAAVEQMIGNIASVNTSVEKMASSFENLETRAVSGNMKQTEMSDRIKSIALQSGMLTEANKAIADIARQTNLLSMNAAIEAAHAGEAGKGFSVVAEEIRKLAETSSEQSKRIGKQLKSINDAIEDVVDTSEETKQTFDNVAESIRETDRIVHVIKNAMAEQNEGSHQIVSALKNMSDSSSEVSCASKEMAAGNKAVLEGVRKLEGMTLAIQNSMEDVRDSARKISATGTSLNGISENMHGAINTIGSQIDNFQV